jgi:hypothetical protein
MAGGITTTGLHNFRSNNEENMQHAEIRAMAYDLLREHGLTDWDFSVSDFKWHPLLAEGFCDHTLQLIMIDQVLCLNGLDAEGVILHEIAHALLPADIEDHGFVWAAKALQLGVSEADVKRHCPTYFEQG